MDREYSSILCELLQIGFNVKHKGTFLLADIIYKAEKDEKGLYIENFEKKYYTELSKYYNQNVKTIKSNITKAVDNMFIFSNMHVRKQYFGYDDVKPTAKIIVITVLNRIRYKL